MANHRPTDPELPPRPRRGPPPRLYVIARQSPVPWLRIRRLGEADRGAFVAHLLGLAAEQAGRHGAPDRGAVATLSQAVEFRAVILFGAIAGNAVIAAACGLPGAAGREVVATEDAGYRQRGLGEMLIRQVLGAQPMAEVAPRRIPDPAAALPALMLRLGGWSGTALDDAAGPG
ncbi:hypothetical protein [Paracraurococcus lichenis]|uniref:GNAT family N-acetyltransferase n=1 Tax=Paracraurococcus lichenis TaxID=3064888 RepID=A0ABT9DSG5_9PROT|nr:hypothetical protein [Paracraurococcus sp. LOR1-02]MDO9706828.1 hypothetical protein [Paracraurococcus sp. LOR1-02]